MRQRCLTVAALYSNLYTVKNYAKELKLKQNNFCEFQLQKSAMDFDSTKSLTEKYSV